MSIATLLAVAGDNPERLRSESALASLCGVNPIEASSGKIVRHRLNRSGNRAMINFFKTYIDTSPDSSVILGFLGSDRCSQGE